MQQAIKIATKNGWDMHADIKPIAKFPTLHGGEITVSNHLLLDPLFWQALGKGLGWGDVLNSHPVHKNRFAYVWQVHWHYFIDHLAEGKDIDSFFEELCKNT